MSRYLIFNFDGTWSGRDDLHGTNVRRMHHALSQDDQVSFYFAGPGNEDENGWLGRFLGGAFGIGFRSIRDQGLDTLAAVYEPGDRIAVIGFSRGAAIARLFCDRVCTNGVNGHDPGIEFLGIFDTIMALLPFGIFQQETLFNDLNVSPKVIRVRHAVALDEDRISFEPNLINKRKGAKEVWFSGNHGDVGGMYEEDGLADITMEWMVKGAVAAGLDLTFNRPRNPEYIVHHEDYPKRKRPRKVCVQINDACTNIPAIIHPITHPAGGSSDG